jgi:hypothetical protein
MLTWPLEAVSERLDFPLVGTPCNIWAVDRNGAWFLTVVSGACLSRSSAIPSN